MDGDPGNGMCFLGLAQGVLLVEKKGTKVLKISSAKGNKFILVLS